MQQRQLLTSVKRGFGVAVFLWLSSSVWSQTPGDLQLQEAQRDLNALGYDVGTADGIFGQRTREALATFQHDQQLLETGILDAATQQALSLSAPEATTPDSTSPDAESIAIDTAPALQQAVTPLSLIVDYLRFYDSQPARVLPYITEHFRGGLSSSAWLEYTLDILETRRYRRLAWEIQHIDLGDNQATIQVRSRIRVDDQESIQQESFSLLRASEEPWRIDAWQSQAAEEEK